MITHVIYHIYGRKVGCTKNFHRRKGWYRFVDGYTDKDFEILEELHNKTDQEAGDIERQWAGTLGYKPGNHYAVTIKNVSQTPIEKRREIGNRLFELRLGIHSLSSQDKAEAGRKGANRVNELGLGGFQNMTRQQYAEAGRKGGSRTSSLGHSSFQTRSRDEHQKLSREAGQKGGRTGASGRHQAALGSTPFQRKSTCIFCGAECTIANIKRWHDDNCRKRPLARRT
jgi:general stress protein YciG